MCTALSIKKTMQVSAGNSILQNEGVSSKRPLTVRFAKKVEVIICSNASYGMMSDSESSFCIQSLWYDKNDYAFFEQNTWSLANGLRSIEMALDDPNSWARSLLRVYKTVNKESSSYDEMKTVLGEFVKNVTFSPQYVGIDDMVILNIRRDRCSRRQRLRHAMARVQQDGQRYARPEDDRAEAIRKVSLHYSHGARMYARYLAHTAAANASF